MKFKLIFICIVSGLLSTIQAMEKSDMPLSIPLCTQLFDKKYDLLSHKNINEALKMEKMSILVTKEACQSFINGNVIEHDANVGDNMCQVRAEQMACVFDNQTYNDDMQNLAQKLPSGDVLQKLIDEINATIQSKDQKKIAELNTALKKVPLQQFLISKSINAPLLPGHLKALILNNIITRFYSDVEKKRKNKTKDFCKSFDITDKKTKDIFKAARVMLNNFTNQYLDSEAQASNDSACLALVKQKEGQEQGFVQSSTYGTLVLLIKQIEQKQIPVALKAQVLCPDHGVHIVTVDKTAQPSNKKAMIVFDGISDPYHLVAADLKTDDLEEEISKKPKVDGTCQKIEELQKALVKIPLKDLVLANGAMHGQFLDKKKDIDFTQCESGKQLEQEFNQYKQLALKEGLCKENGSKLRLVHIFADVKK